MTDAYQQLGLLERITDWMEKNGMFNTDYYPPALLNDFPSERDLMLRDTGRINLEETA